MMVINCSLAAANHLYAKDRQGRDEGFFGLLQPGPETLAERQQKLEQQGGRQWMVHAVRMGCSTSLIAMEYHTRWTHVIHRVRKGDVKGFIERLYFRLINGIEWLGTGLLLFTVQEMEVAIGHYQAQYWEEIKRSQRERRGSKKVSA
jgi:hypothetical protein